jgi:hypothetical protein
VSRRQVDELKKIYDKEAARGVKIVTAIIAETDEFGGRMILEDDVFEYIEQTKVPFPVYMDEMDAIVGDYGVQTVPMLAFISKGGKLAFTRPFTYAADITRILDALIAGEDIDTSGMETVAG